MGDPQVTIYVNFRLPLQLLACDVMLVVTLKGRTDANYTCAVGYRNSFRVIFAAQRATQDDIISSFA